MRCPFQRRKHNAEEIGPCRYCRCAVDVYGERGLLHRSEKATKKCKVVETKPTETTWIQGVRPPSRPRAMLTSRSRQFAFRKCHNAGVESGAAVIAALFYGRRFLRSRPRSIGPRVTFSCITKWGHVRYWHKAAWLVRCACPLLGVKRTCPFASHMSAYDPKRTCRAEHPLNRAVKSL